MEKHKRCYHVLQQSWIKIREQIYKIWRTVEFYPSISETLPQKAINFAKNFTKVDEDKVNLILHCRKSLLFDQNDKQGGNPFDVTIGSFDVAEICELVCLFLLHELKSLTEDVAIGLYRDDGLAFIRNVNGPIVDEIKEKITNIFQCHNLKITLEANLIQEDFLDITFNLKSEKYWPYRKPTNQLLYINSKSNHPPPIKKQIPQMVSGRLSQNSWNQKVFDQATSIYQEALKKSGFTEKIQYTSTHTNKNGKSNRKRKVTWFNPSFNDAVSTNIGKEFFKLQDKHFPAHHKLHKICNRNTIKMGYAACPMFNLSSADTTKIC